MDGLHSDVDGIFCRAALTHGGLARDGCRGGRLVPGGLFGALDGRLVAVGTAFAGGGLGRLDGLFLFGGPLLLQIAEVFVLHASIVSRMKPQGTLRPKEGRGMVNQKHLEERCEAVYGLGHHE